MTHKIRVVFFGTEAWAVPTLEALIEQFEVVAVVTKPDAPSGRGHRLTSSPIKEVAVRCKIPVLEPEKLASVAKEMVDLQADFGVVIAYGKLIPDGIIDSFDHGIINCHPSALPRHRGPSPIEAAILAGDRVTVSIIQLCAEMDAGDVLAKAELSGHHDGIDAPALYAAAGLVGAELIVEVIHGLGDGTITPHPQDRAQATFSPMIAKLDGIIDWTKPATLLEREIRAYAGWPASKTVLKGRDIIITSAHVAAMSPATTTTPGTPLLTYDGSLAFQTGQGLLVVDSLKPAGKREMTGQAYLAGHSLP